MLSTTESKRRLVVWSARGGHGASTIAAVMARVAGAAIEGAEPWTSDWILGCDPGKRVETGRTVVDAGVFRGKPVPVGKNVIVLRGPCLIGLKALYPLADSVDHLIVLRERWRVTTNEETEAVLKTPVVAEVPFSERVARLSDAGLLGARLDKLEEFDDLRQWTVQAFGTAMDR